MARVLFVADGWGFGPITSAQSIAAALPEEDQTWFMGDGPGLGMARRGGFHETLRAHTMANTPTPDLHEAIRQCDLLVSVMNPIAARLASDLDRPCVYADDLMWMWSRPPSLPASTPRFAVVSFPGQEANIRRWQNRFPHQPIAPLIRPGNSTRPLGGAGALVSFGGLFSPVMAQSVQLSYARTMVEVATLALSRWPGPITVAVGDHILEQLDPTRLRLVRDDVRIAGLSQADYLAELERSGVLISSPGQHSIQEAMARQIPCLLLPSQNLSQALQAQALAQAGAASLFDWDAIYRLVGLTASDEQQSCSRICGCILRFEKDTAARTRLARHLGQQLMPEELAQVASAQEALQARYSDHGQGPRQVAEVARRLICRQSNLELAVGGLVGMVLALLGGARADRWRRLAGSPSS